jgi:Na+/H+ antiporter NhaD/arsenite permease-like protein
MAKKLRRTLLVVVLLSLALVLQSSHVPVSAQDAEGAPLVVGEIRDGQNVPVSQATVQLVDGATGAILVHSLTQPDGTYSLDTPQQIPDTLEVHVERTHFEPLVQPLSDNQVERLRAGETLALPMLELSRHISAAFWVAAVIFLLVLVFIAGGVVHNTLATLMGASLLYAFSYLGESIHEGLFIFDFERSLSYVDWNVIFLIMGMMIVIAVVENTGIFQWLAFFAYRVSGGRVLLLLPILMLITGVASAFLDNVTTMLLMTPITVQIALALGISPLALLLPEVMASNVVGVSTLVGTPTNILIGSYGDISFNDFLVNLTPGVLLAFVGLVVYSWFTYRKELSQAHEPSEVLVERLAERGQIREPTNLKKAGVVFAGMLILFVVGESFHLLPSVTAIMGATALMIWIRPDIEEMIEAVDWTTLVFFLALFIVVGAVQEVGIISLIADVIGRLVGDSILLAMMGLTVFSALLSTVIANIPFTAAMLPVVKFLSGTVPGATSNVLYYCLSVGSAMGGNGSLIGASANMVTAGISNSAGYRISYSYFLKKGIPALLITVALAMIWLLIRF